MKKRLPVLQAYYEHVFPGYKLDIVGTGRNIFRDFRKMHWAKPQGIITEVVVGPNFSHHSDLMRCLMSSRKRLFFWFSDDLANILYSMILSSASFLLFRISFSNFFQKNYKEFNI